MDLRYYINDTENKNDMVTQIIYIWLKEIMMHILKGICWFLEGNPPTRRVSGTQAFLQGSGKWGGFVISCMT